MSSVIPTTTTTTTTTCSHRHPSRSSSRCLLLVIVLVGLTTSIQGAAQPGDPWINEFHYDNAGTDRNEFVEIAAPRALDVSNYQLVLYDGFYGRIYEEDAYYSLQEFDTGKTVNGITFYNLPVRPQNCSALSRWCGLENGKDGFALAEFFTPTTGRVVEFLSYEGTFVAKDGPAANMSSYDVGVFQRTTTPEGFSISKIGRGCHSDDFVWANVNGSTPGDINTNQTVTCEVAFINEFHYTDTEDGVGQFVEVALDLKDPNDLGQYSVVLYSGVDGFPYDAITLNEFEVGDTLEKDAIGDDLALFDEDGITFYHYEFPAGSSSNVGMDIGTPMVDSNGNTTMAPAGLALVINDMIVLEFISYGGSFNATGGPANGMASFDVNVTEDSETPVGSSIQLTGDGCDAKDFVWIAVEASNVDIGNDDVGETPGEINIGQTIDCSIDYELLNATAEAALAELLIEEDDLIAEDDDFLGEDAVIISEGDRNRRGPVIYVQGPGKSKPIKKNN